MVCRPPIWVAPRKSWLSSATKVVAVGGMKDGAFHATKLLIKCPSKYESTQKAS